MEDVRQVPKRVTRFKTKLVSLLFIVGLLSIVTLAVADHFNQKTGDPGGRILSQLRLTEVAIPPGSKIAYANYQEPQLDSCDGKPSTLGWNDAVVQISFNWSGTDRSLVTFANQQLAAHGWSVHIWSIQQNLTSAGWTKQLENGSRSEVELSREANGGWLLLAQAPPLGRHVSTC